MADIQDAFGLLTLLILVMTGITLLQIYGGADSDETVLVILVSNTNLLLAIVIFLVIIGAIISVTQDQR